MAGNPVTPQRVRDILSSFLYRTEQGANQTQPDSENQPPNPQEKEAATPNKRLAAGDAVSSNAAKPSPEVASARRSYSSFLKRVETFSPVTWFAKPPQLSPLVCARYGWVNSEYDMLHCTACQANLCGALPSKSDRQTYNEACRELEQKLISAHEKFCTLAVNPCPESYLKVCLDEPDELRKQFILRLSTLKQCTRPLPQLEYSKLETWGFSEGHAAKFLTEEKLSEADTSTGVITLAFTGWTLSEGNKEILVCSICRRQIGLWNYSSPAKHTTSSDNQNGHSAEPSSEAAGDMEPPSKLRKMTPKDKLDPVSSHHLWCPWVALRDPSEDALSPALSMGIQQSPSSPPSESPSSTQSPSQAQSPSLTDSPGCAEGGVGDGGDVGPQKVPAWVLVAQIVAPGLLSQSRRLVQQVKQGSMVDGLRCIRKMLSTWSSPEKVMPTSATN